MQDSKWLNVFKDSRSPRKLANGFNRSSLAEFEGVSFTKNFECISYSEIISRESKVCPDSWLIYELIAILSWGETTKAT